jgi:dihydrolipoamide dehydrogenase
MADRVLDVVVIGGGPAGEVASARLAAAGLEVALVERELVGGECAFWACMPSKALLRPADVLAEAARVGGAREVAGEQPDVDATLRRRDEVIRGLDDSVLRAWLEEKGVVLLNGKGRLDGERRVRVGETSLSARRAVVVAVGTGAAMPPIEGLAEAAAWSNREATTAKTAPERLVVLGGGVVGVEMAQAWATLGSRVTLLEALPRLLAQEEPFAGDQVADALRAHGVDVRLGAKATAVRRADGELTVTLDDASSVTGDELLVAVGRRPLTAGLGLETVGLEPGGSIEVDDTLRVKDGPEWLYAVGDVNGRSLLTHAAKYQAWAATEQILGRDARVSEDGPASPRVVFTDPQVAAVGHTLERAVAAGLNASAVDHATAAVAGASFVGREAPGTARLVLDRDRGVLIGATFTGPEVAEMLHAATIAIVGEVPVERLRHALPSFPTRSEVWLRLQDKLERALAD